MKKMQAEVDRQAAEIVIAGGGRTRLLIGGVPVYGDQFDAVARPVSVDTDALRYAGAAGWRGNRQVN